MKNEKVIMVVAAVCLSVAVWGVMGEHAHANRIDELIDRIEEMESTVQYQAERIETLEIQARY